MCDRAASTGANAVIAMRYNADDGITRGSGLWHGRGGCRRSRFSPAIFEFAGSHRACAKDAQCG